ncbi:hypothetical protein ACQB60_07325 [Actinomycetota bacterium Odt1-20B]
MNVSSTPTVTGQANPPTYAAWPGAVDAELAARLRSAVLALLDELPSVMEDMRMPFSQAVTGGGEIACESAQLDASWAQLSETDAIRLVANAAGDRSPSLFSPTMPRVIATVDGCPLSAQFRVIGWAAERLVSDQRQASSHRSIAAVSRSPQRQGSPRSTAIAEASGRASTHLSSAESRRAR